MKKNRILSKVPFFVLLISIYPSLALLSFNIREVDANVILRPLAYSVLITCLLTLILLGIFKDLFQASLSTTILLVLFFSYGHVVRFLIDRFNPNYNKTIEIILYLLFCTIAFFAITRIRKGSLNKQTWTNSLNMAGIVLIVLPFIQIISSFNTSTGKNDSQPMVNTPRPPSSSQPLQDTPATPNNQYPDIYYIILDGYSRADTLKVMGFDNSGFINSLESMGFYVASCSRSTYRHTLLSMSSAFSMDYLWRAIPNNGVSDSNATPLYEALLHNRVRSELEQRGYKIVGFQTGYQWDEWKDADIYLAPGTDAKKDSANGFSIDPFEYLFLRNTAVYPFLENSRFAIERYYEHYDRVNFTLDELPNIASIPGPKFVYAHIMAPHTPYLFLPDGSINTDSRYYNTETGTPSNPDLVVKGYLNNIRFLNSRIPGMLREIIKNSKTPPVIILQGDHGYVFPERRFNNLMAYYLPNKGNDLLYPTITPVNNFRVVFHLYFGTPLGLRRDVSLDADVGRPYKKTEVQAFPETCP